MNILTERWIVVDGSIYTENAVPVKSEFTGKLIGAPQRAAIAFNVGNKIANHIANLHNSELQPTTN